MKRNIKLVDWAGKTIDFAEIKGEVYLVHFTDGTSAEITAYIRESPSQHWGDTAEVEIEFDDGVK